MSTPVGITRSAARSLRRALTLQEHLWDAYLSGLATSGQDARATVGEPPVRWSGRRLRGRVLPGPG